MRIELVNIYKSHGAWHVTKYWLNKSFLKLKAYYVPGTVLNN